MLSFFKGILFPKVAVVKDNNTITYRTDYSNLLFLTNILAIFIIFKQFHRIQSLAQLCEQNAKILHS
jgi:hypothetical protein